MARCILFLSCLLVAGCATDFGRGFADATKREVPTVAADAIGEVIDAKLSSQNADLKTALKEVVNGVASAVPKPAPAEDHTFGYALGSAIGMALALALRGGVRMLGDKMGGAKDQG